MQKDEASLWMSIEILESFLIGCAITSHQDITIKIKLISQNHARFKAQKNLVSDYKEMPMDRAARCPHPNHGHQATITLLMTRIFLLLQV